MPTEATDVAEVTTPEISTEGTQTQTDPEVKTAPEVKTVEAGEGEGEGKSTEIKQDPEEERKGRFKARLDRHKERAAAAEARAAELAAKLAEVEAKLAPQPTASADKFPTLEDYGFDEEKHREAVQQYVDAQATKKLETARKEEAERVLNETKAETDKRVREAWQNRHEQAQKKFDDFEEVMEDFAEIVLPRPMFDFISSPDTEKGAELAYYLGKNPAEFSRISKLSPARQVAELGKLEDRLPTLLAAKPSQAPPPPVPVDGRAVVKKKESEMSDSEWWAHRKALKMKAT